VSFSNGNSFGENEGLNGDDDEADADAGIDGRAEACFNRWLLMRFRGGRPITTAGRGERFVNCSPDWTRFSYRERRLSKNNMNQIYAYLDVLL
jgi:hypothetical protein